jgi:molybdopterin molybdotransferase
MISMDEAITLIKENMLPPTGQEFSLDRAAGKYLAVDVFSPEPSPRYTNSAMDGYAVCWQDVSGTGEESPVSLKIVGESRAGMPYANTVQSGQAVRISTGAMVPDGADTVIRVEDTRESDGLVAILSVRKKGQDIRYQGEEFDVGALLLRRGTRISAPQASLLASVGIGHVTVFKPCDVALLVTGSELVATGAAIADYQIRDSNMIMLQTAVQEAGGNLVSCLRVADTLEGTIEAIGAVDADIILCTGGVSVGRHDHVKEAAEQNGFVQQFWRIRQKPGKPLYFAARGDTLLFGLPGNPVSAFMCFAHYVRPLIGTLAGLPFGWPTVSGQAINEITNRGSRPNMIRVQITWRHHGGYGITNAEKQGSHMLTSLADADGYIILGPEQTIKAGERIDVYRYDFRREPV